eukprot:1143869-Pelagomonas_calceolata.AAC.7
MAYALELANPDYKWSGCSLLQSQPAGKAKSCLHSKLVPLPVTQQSSAPTCSRRLTLLYFPASASKPPSRCDPASEKLRGDRGALRGAVLVRSGRVGLANPGYVPCCCCCGGCCCNCWCCCGEVCIGPAAEAGAAGDGGAKAGAGAGASTAREGLDAGGSAAAARAAGGAAGAVETGRACGAVDPPPAVCPAADDDDDDDGAPDAVIPAML